MNEYIIRKITKKQGGKIYHKYYDKKMNEICHIPTLKKITEGIYIPPAYNNVKINLHKHKKVRAIGYDVKGRPQYIYHKEFTQEQSDKKFDHMIQFGKKYHKINKTINEDLNSSNITNKQIAIILRLIMDCQFRIGNEKYFKDNQSYGTTTLEKKHMKIKNKSIDIDFIGKKNVRNKCTVKNKKVVHILKKRNKSLKDKNQQIFTISSKQVNDYLKQFGNFSAKNFRTWGANIEFILHILKLCKEKNEYSISELKNILHQSIHKVAKKLHNTKNVCKSNYLDPELIKFFTNDYKKFLQLFYNNKKQINREKISRLYVSFLENI